MLKKGPGKYLLLIPLAITLAIAIWHMAAISAESKATADINDKAMSAVGLAPHGTTKGHGRPFNGPDTSDYCPPSVPPEGPDEPDGTVPDIVQELLGMDLQAARNINPDVIGWVCIPETNVSYPILQGTTNQDYLKIAWNGKNSNAGSIFLDAKNQPDFTGYNSILYGHRMKDGSMFAVLHDFRDQSFALEHQDAYVRLPDGVLGYQLFSVYEVSKTGNPYLPDISADTFPEWLQACKDANEITGLSHIPENCEQILTLSTCANDSKNYRVVTQYYLVCEWPVETNMT